MNISSTFTEGNCGSGLDLGIPMNYFGNVDNQTYTWDCFGTIQAWPSIVPCFSNTFLTFCIGGVDQQHACIAGNCKVIDWTKQHASPCPSTIMDFVDVQPAGVASPCCDSLSCTISPPHTFNCAPNIDLWFCVVDGKAAECVKPSDNRICSGNLTHAVGVVPSTTSSDPFSSPTGTFSTFRGTSTSTPQAPSSSAGTSGGLSTKDTIVVVVVSVVVLFTSLVGVILFRKVLLPAYRRRRMTSTPGPDSFAVNGGALTAVQGDSHTYHIY
jgi:hypothetical protein